MASISDVAKLAGVSVATVNVDGVVVFGHMKENRKIQELLTSDIPTVFIDIDLSGPRACYITSDNYNGIVEACTHLHQLGHRSIGFISAALRSYVSQARYDGYAHAIRKLSLPFKPEHICIMNDLSFSVESGYQAMERLLGHPDPPDAVICTSDTMAIGAIRAAEKFGLSVPRDIAVIGFDDSDFCEYVHPKLTSIRQNVGEIGELAVKTLIDMVENGEDTPPAHILPTRLIVRQSCGASL